MIQKNNILFVHSGDDWIAGSERVLLDIIDSLDRGLYSIMVICNSRRLYEELTIRGVVAEVFPLTTLLLYGGHNPLSYIRSILKLASVIKRNSIHVIHTTSGLSTQYSLPAARITGIPIISHIQGTHLKSSRICSLIEYSDYVVSVSHSIARDYRRAGERLKVIYNGIDTQKFSPNQDWRNEVRREWKVEDHELVVGTTAQLIRRKRPDFFIEAASLIKEAIPGVKFVIAGGGPLKDEAYAQIRRLNLYDSFLMLDFRADINKVLCGFDTFMFTSAGEALPLAPLEAASSGVPVVAGDTVGLCEVVKNGLTGFLVDPDSAFDYAERCIPLLQDITVARQMGSAGRDMVVSGFSIEAFRLNIQQMYERVFA